MQGLMAHCGTKKIGRAELAEIVPPPSTDTHKPIAHLTVVKEVETALAYRNISIKSEEFAISPDGMRMFGFLRLDAEFAVGNFALGLRNANDKSMRLGMVAGYSVFVCDNMAFAGEFKPVLAKHTKGTSLQDVITLGIDRVQRNFASIERSVGEWQGRTISDGTAKALFWDAFNGKDLGLPKSLIPAVNTAYFNPQQEEFRPRTVWSLSNAFTSAFKELKPVRQFQATAKLTPFIEARL
jgi:hypothetical protein